MTDKSLEQLMDTLTTIMFNLGVVEISMDLPSWEKHLTRDELKTLYGLLKMSCETGRAWNRFMRSIIERMQKCGYAQPLNLDCGSDPGVK